MPSNYEVVDSSKEPSPMLGLYGFIILIVVGGLSFLVSGPFTRYLTSAHVALGASGLQLLPLKFPANWSPLGHQAAVAFAVFLVVMVFSMIILFMFMKPKSDDESSVSLDVMRKEVEARKKSR